MTGPLKKLRAALVDRMVAEGAQRTEAEHAVGALGDGHILAFLLAHGGDIAALVKLLMSLLNGGAPVPAV